MQRLVVVAQVLGTLTTLTWANQQRQSPLAAVPPSPTEAATSLAETCPIESPRLLLPADPPPLCLDSGGGPGHQHERDGRDGRDGRDSSDTIAVNKLRDYIVPGWTGPHECTGRFCLYANAGGLASGSAGDTVHGDQGIVVITTKTGFERIKQISKDIEKAAAKKRQGDRSSSDSRSQSSDPPVRVVPIEGKGLGLVATRPLRRGDPLMTAYPALLAHRTFIDKVPRRQQHRLLVAAVRLMPDATREAFLAQAGQGGWWDGSGDEDELLGAKVWDIVWTNSFQMDVGNSVGGKETQTQFENADEEARLQQYRDKEGHHYGNFPAVSRLNHDCRPNLAFRMDELLMHHTTVARDVAEGEELTISYLDPFVSYEKRQQRTKASWGFKCTCSICSASPKEIAASDARLKELATIYEALEGFKTSPPGIVTIKKIDRMLALYKKERLDAFLAGGYTLAALNLNMFARRARAVEMAKRAAEATLIEHGPDAPDVKAMLELAERPEEHFTWRARLRAP